MFLNLYCIVLGSTILLVPERTKQFELRLLFFNISNKNCGIGISRTDDELLGSPT